MLRSMLVLMSTMTVWVWEEDGRQEAGGEAKHHQKQSEDTTPLTQLYPQDLEEGNIQEGAGAEVMSGGGIM